MFIHGQVVLGSVLDGTDGRAGILEDLYFQGEQWSIRYLLINAGHWLDNRMFFVVPDLVEQRDWVTRQLRVGRSREQLRHSAVLDPAELAADAGQAASSSQLLAGPTVTASDVPHQPPQFHSARSLVGFTVEAFDGPLGIVKDVVIDDETPPWELRYLVVDARSALPGRHLVLSPHWADGCFWEAQKLRMGLLRKTVCLSPPYDPTGAITRAYEDQLCDYYGMTKYWSAHHV